MTAIKGRLVLSLIFLCIIALPAFCADDWGTYTSADVTFRYPLSLGDKPDVRRVASQKLDNPDDKPDGVAPAHWELTFADSEAQIFVFPTSDPKVEDFRKAYPTVADATRDLGLLLKEEVARPADIPFLPWADASSPVHAHVRYIDFKNGSGVRFLASYQIEPDVISNKGLVYSMQGLSQDGKFYVSVFIPVKNQGLPTKSDIAGWSKQKYDEFSKNFKVYAKEEERKLERAADEKFDPHLVDLDTLVRSIKLQ
ncbi:MAG: hypothetical protein K2Z81_21955 [Cyanobacteria bacterium]|nr:hypothetical protein [Cyanobacteriota bacterium]